MQKHVRGQQHCPAPRSSQCTDVQNRHRPRHPRPRCVRVRLPCRARSRLRPPVPGRVHVRGDGTPVLRPTVSEAHPPLSATVSLRLRGVGPRGVAGASRRCAVCGDGLGVSLGAVRGAASEVAARGASGWEHHAIEHLLAAPAMHVDETSLRVDRSNHWIHVYSAGTLTVKWLHRKRGREAIEAIGIIPRYTGVAVHDCWASCLSYAHCDHALCGAHLLRELTFIVDAHGYAWAKRMRGLPSERTRANSASSAMKSDTSLFKLLRRRQEKRRSFVSDCVPDRHGRRPSEPPPPCVALS